MGVGTRSYVKPTVFTPYSRKNNRWLIGKKSSLASFSMPGINLPAYRNIYSIHTMATVWIKFTKISYLLSNPEVNLIEEIFH